MGYTIAQREEMRAWDAETNPMMTLSQLYGRPQVVSEPPVGA